MNSAHETSNTDDLIKKMSIYTWVKDTKFRFISCSENLVELAGEDSPSGMIGKDDYSLIWRAGAKAFRENDIGIIKGTVKHINAVEVIDVSNESGADKQRILITKAPIYNKKGICVGIAGSHVNIPFNETPTKHVRFDTKGRLYLPTTLGNEYLTKKEVLVLKKIILGKSSKQIAKEFSCSPRTIEEFTDNIKKKLQCSHKNEICSVVIEYGISHLLSNHD